MYLQVQKEKRLKEKSMQTVTREETPKETEAPKEAEIVQTVQRKTIDYKKLLQGLFIVSTGIILIPLYICITVTKNLK